MSRSSQAYYEQQQKNIDQPEFEPMDYEEYQPIEEDDECLQSD